MMHRRIALVVALASLGQLGQPRRARAGACPSPQVRVYPEPMVMAPTNVTLRLVFEADEVTVYELTDPQTRQIRKTGHVRASSARVALRDLRGREVPVTLHRPPSTRNPMIFVRPNRPLPARSRLAVVLRAGAREYVVSTLHTGAGPVVIPPTIGRVERALYSAYPPARHWKDPTGKYVFVTLSEASGATAFEVHELEGNVGPSAATLRAVVPRPLHGKVVLGLLEGGACHRANFRFPLVAPRRRSHPLRLGIRALNDAGHVSPLREVTLDLAKPGRVVRPGIPKHP